MIYIFKFIINSTRDSTNNTYNLLINNSNKLITLITQQYTIEKEERWERWINEIKKKKKK